MAPAHCVFKAACDLWSVLLVLRQTCEEALVREDNRTWSKGSPLVGGRCALTSLPLFTVHFLPACALLFNATPYPTPSTCSIPSLDAVHFLSAVSEPSSRWRSWPGRLGWRCAFVRVLLHNWGEIKSCSYCQENTVTTSATCMFMQVCCTCMCGHFSWCQTDTEALRSFSQSETAC